MSLRKIFHLKKSFFKLLTERNFTGAERELERMKLKVKPSLKYNGYFHALNGMIVAMKSNDKKHAFINRIHNININQVKKEFLTQSKNPLQTDFDGGFFVAWVDYLNFVSKINRAS